MEWNYFTQTDYSTLIFRVFPLDQIAHVRVSPSINLKPISREVIFEQLHGRIATMMSI